MRIAECGMGKGKERGAKGIGQEAKGRKDRLHIFKIPAGACPGKNSRVRMTIDDEKKHGLRNRPKRRLGATPRKGRIEPQAPTI